MKKKYTKKMSEEFMGASVTRTPYTTFNSGSRNYMTNAMAAQTVVPRSPDVPRSLTGYEDQLSDYTLSIKAPCDCVIVEVVGKYPGGIGDAHIASNPLVTLIYQDEESGEFGNIHLFQYHNQLERIHEIFSFKYELTPLGVRACRMGTRLRKGDVLSKSITVGDDGMYTTTINANVVYLPTPPTIEDGYDVLDEWLYRGEPVATKSYVAECGKKYYPLNMYGDKDNYKPVPDIGDPIRRDGIIFALRAYDPAFDGINMTNSELMSVDRAHDVITYVDPSAINSHVFDITVHTTTNDGNHVPHLPCGMDKQFKKYSNATSLYHSRLVKFYDDLRKATYNSGDSFTLTPSLQTLITNAMGDKPNTTLRANNRATGQGSPVKKTFRANPLDEYRIEVMVQYHYPISLGGKITNPHGHKGVVCNIRKREDMPVDDYGNVADVIVYGLGAIGRLNPGQFYEHYINAFARDVSLDIRAFIDKGEWDAAWAHYLRYIEAASPELMEYIVDTPDEREEILGGIYTSGIYNMVNASNESLNKDVYYRIQSFRPPNKSRVTFTDQCGKRVTTRRDALIGPVTFHILEKIDNKPMAVAGVTRQHYGISSGLTKRTKHRSPGKQQPARVFGETETRQAASVMGGEAIAETLRMSTDPDTHRGVCAALYNAKRPSDIDDVIDRTKPKPLGRPVTFVLHTFNGFGLNLVTVDDNEEDV